MQSDHTEDLEENEDSEIGLGRVGWVGRERAAAVGVDAAAPSNT